MTKMTIETDSKGKSFRMYRQRTHVTCGPAACLIMWANVNNADPIADEGGVIALTQKYPGAWNAVNGANIGNLSRVLAEMGIPNELVRYDNGGKFRSGLHNRVHNKKPALVFAEWEVNAAVRGHFAVVAYADAALDKFTVLDPYFGMQEPGGLPSYYVYVDGTPNDPSLMMTGAVIFVK